MCKHMDYTIPPNTAAVHTNICKPNTVHTYVYLPIMTIVIHTSMYFMYMSAVGIILCM